MTVLLSLLVLFACSQTETVCREGTTLEEDGHCYPPMLDRPPTIDDAIDALPDCEPATGGEGQTVDIARGCASGACAGDTYNQMVDVLGEEGDCVTTSFDNRQVYCTWETLGIDGLFLDDNRDEIPDPGRRTDRIHIFPPHIGATEDGVGISASTSCFFESLGHPARLVLFDIGGEMMVRDLLYDQYGMVAYDLGDDDDSGIPNGYIDNMYLYGY